MCVVESKGDLEGSDECFMPYQSPWAADDMPCCFNDVETCRALVSFSFATPFTSCVDECGGGRG